MNLCNASVIGFFSLPSLSLAEHNPSAYNNAMAGAPSGAGTCANCGQGIRHHVVVRLDDGRTVFIGQDCAMRVGEPSLRSCVRSRLTAEQLAAREAERDAKHAEWQAEQDRVNAFRARRAEAFADILPWLEAKPYEFQGSDEAWQQYVDTGSTFLTSLARQLRQGSLSYRQAECVAKQWYNRRTKKNAADFDALCERLTRDARELDAELLAEPQAA